MRTFPSASSPRLIWLASLSRSPLAPVRLLRSLPARSTKVIEGVRTAGPPSTPLPDRSHDASVPDAAGLGECSTRSSSVNSACERDEDSFSCVAAVVRRAAPSSRRARAASTPSTARRCADTRLSLIPGLGDGAGLSHAFLTVAAVEASEDRRSRSSSQYTST